MRERLARLLAAFILFLPAVASAGHTVTVFAASSMKEALDDLARQFETATGHRIFVSYLGSNAHARQIEAGAPAEVFISADADWIDYVVAKGRAVPDSRRELVRNELVLVAPARSDVALSIAPGFPLKAALADKRLAIANPDVVPAGKYAKAALQSLGVWEGVKDRLAPGESVRAALAFVAAGAAPLGIVYRTDALAERSVKILGKFPPRSHPPIVYSLVLMKRANQAARVFAEFVASPKAQATWWKHGFITDPERASDR